ncbi:type II toxin-antitoxin system RelE/ParE family toxin [uncultured Aquimarina sp.]|uniref:type II toxin-antitoxin system RelE/ParE family toxin n=1 Tax=uncultured Aquimarina sp. TaxID=575652 RepID=UPI002638C977|nr:type II toxin-antitoxin system RelE/ParE family toxin [uncultured Aquimarina sp.]
MFFLLTPEAKDSLKSIGKITHKQYDNKQRDIYLKLLDDSFKHLTEFPMQGVARSEIHAGLRSNPVKEHIVYYLTKKDHNVIVGRGINIILQTYPKTVIVK